MGAKPVERFAPHRSCDSLRAHCSGCSALVTAVAIAPEKSDRAGYSAAIFFGIHPAVRDSEIHADKDLVRAGKMYLTAQDAIALALENNIDIESARYNPLILESQLRRQPGGWRACPVYQALRRRRDGPERPRRYWKPARPPV